MSTEEHQSVQRLNADKSAAAAVAHTWVGFFALLSLAVAWASGVAIAAYQHGALMLLGAALFPPIGWVLYAAHLLGLSQ